LAVLPPCHSSIIEEPLTLAVWSAIGNRGSDITWGICAVTRELLGIQATSTITWVTYIARNVIGSRWSLSRNTFWVLALSNIFAYTGKVGSVVRISCINTVTLIILKGNSLVDTCCSTTRWTLKGWLTR
jgi:hypothetical protein